MEYFLACCGGGAPVRATLLMTVVSSYPATTLLSHVKQVAAPALLVDVALVLLHPQVEAALAHVKEVAVTALLVEVALALLPP